MAQPNHRESCELSLPECLGAKQTDLGEQIAISLPQGYCMGQLRPFKSTFVGPYLIIPGMSNALSCPLSVTSLPTYVCSSCQDPLFLAGSSLAVSEQGGGWG